MSEQERPLTVAEPPPSDPTPVRAVLAQGSLRWVDGGPLGDWTPVYNRSNRYTGVQDAHHRIALTEVAAPRHSDTARRWLALQEQLVSFEGTEDGREPSSPAGTAVFWRLVVNRRAFALGATVAPSPEMALAQVRRLGRRVRNLQVSFAYNLNDHQPLWAAHDHGRPVLLGLPGHNLAPTDDFRASVAGVLADAEVQRYVHRSGDPL